MVDAIAGRVAVALLKLIRRFDRAWVSDAAAAFTRWVGPWLREHRIGRANLKAAFPNKTDAEIERILMGVWDNLGRVAAEFAHLDQICSGDPMKRDFIAYDDASIERFFRLRGDGKPALIFAAHLANWELPAIIAHSDGLPTTVLYRRPNLGAVADAVIAIRAGNMGEMEPTGLQAPIKLGRALQQGRHVAMLVDQHYVKGVEVTFFGRKCRANPLIAMLARQVECPIHGTRVIRLPGHRFRAEISDEIAPVRDADGHIDIQGTMQAITTVIEGWVREHPEQWLWLHRRWR
jgi:KDO2-lipid IV(A) lauroyltransferase